LSEEIPGTAFDLLEADPFKAARCRLYLSITLTRALGHSLANINRLAELLAFIGRFDRRISSKVAAVVNCVNTGTLHIPGFSGERDHIRTQKRVGDTLAEIDFSKRVVGFF